MSYIASHTFEKVDKEINSITHTMKSSALDNEFKISVSQFSVMGGCTSSYIALDVNDARTLKKQLEEFVAQNS